MRRRALTLIELLLALGILSAMMIAAVGWMQSAATASVAARQELNSSAMAAAVMQLIHDDLMTGDFELTRTRNRAVESRVLAEGEDLSIETRAQGRSVVHVYRWDRSSGQLNRSGHGGSRVLVGNVSEFTCEIDEQAGTLLVTLELGDRTVTRRFTLP